MMTHRLRRAAPVALSALLVAIAIAALGLILPDLAWVALGIAAAIVIFASIWLLGRMLGAVDGWFHRVGPAPALLALDEGLRADLGDRPLLANADYDRLVAYLAAGVRQYRSAGCAHILYPGVPGAYGKRVEGMEGFSRTAPLLAAWISTRGDLIALPDGTMFDAFGHVAAGLQAGTTTSSAEYWGDAEDYDLRIVEAGDIALVAWMLRDRLRAALPGHAQEALLRWLANAQARRIYGGGNWHLFCVSIGLSLEAWGVAHDPATRRHYDVFKESHRGGGWFTDGGRVDHYNAWQMHYFLPFLARMDPLLDVGFIEAALRDFARDYVHLFAPRGFPIFGRSACYRMAVPTPLVMAAGLSHDPFPAGVARRALDAVWTHFIGRGALSAGAVTQGYHGDQPELLENYSGRGSSHWALRSLTAAYFQARTAPIWTAAPEPLPVERASYDLTFEPAGLRVIGDREKGTVEVRPLANDAAPQTPFERMGLFRRIAQVLLRRPLRLANTHAKYDWPAYRSDRPFCGQ